ncbi:MAG: thiamine pyrophosphate-dependent enzyme [Acidimicrobiales bacterium]|jgi:thiamine pyrophosphate-dependent acetolactate synthase large subunit-like protein
MVIPDAGVLDRRSVVARLLRDRDGILVVTGLGSPSYDVHAAGDDEGNYYLWGAMGAAALVGLGLAQAQIDRTVVVITGDGEQLMGLGGLATVAVAAPANLVIVVLDNGHYGETGMQQSHTGFGLDLAAVARAAGFAEAQTIVEEAEVETVAQSIREPATGPRFYAVKVRAESLPRSLPPRDAVHGKNRLRAYLGFQVS